MKTHLLGFFVAIPVPNAQNIQVVHSVMDTFLGSTLGQSQAVRKTFDGVDVGLPQGQVFSVSTPYYLNIQGDALVQPAPMRLLEDIARTCLIRANQVVEGAWAGACWKQQNDISAQALVRCGDKTFRREVKAYTGPLLGSFSATLQAELVSLAWATPLHVLAMHFPHAHEQLLERDLPAAPSIRPNGRRF